MSRGAGLREISRGSRGFSGPRGRCSVRGPRIAPKRNSSLVNSKSDRKIGEGVSEEQREGTRQEAGAAARERERESRRTVPSRAVDTIRDSLHGHCTPFRAAQWLEKVYPDIPSPLPSHSLSLLIPLSREAVMYPELPGASTRRTKV